MRQFIMLGLIICLLTTNAMAQETTLTPKERVFVSIAAFTATGNIDKLKPALHEGLDAGLTVNEIKEILVQMYAYAGFPRSLNGLGELMTVVKERQEKGVKDEIGKEASPPPKDKSILELGTAVQTQLVGTPVKGPLFDFAPAIDEYLKTHLFGDIFARDVLDFQQREIATIAALASLDGVESQLQGHLRIGLNVGLSEKQLRELIAVLETKVGKKEANRATGILNKILDPNAPESGTEEKNILIVKSRTQASIKCSSEYFTGNVRLDPLFPARDERRTTAGLVTFEPGARTAWHTHPIGQSLIVVSGVGRVRQWGGEIQEIKAGDVVWFSVGQCIHYALSRPAVVSTMIGCRNRTEILEAVRYLDMTEEERDYTEVAKTLKDTFRGKCMYCNHCLPCPAEIDIASVTKYLEIAMLDENDIPPGTRSHYRSLSHKASECIQCGSCEDRCPFNVAVIENMKRAVKVFGE